MIAPKVQLALDVIEAKAAIRLGQIGLECGVDWLEIGKPLIEFEGLNGVSAVVEAFPTTPVVLDLMIMAGPERYLRAAADLGAASVTVTALAPEGTVRLAIDEAHARGIDITVDLFNVTDAVTQARHYADLGASLMVHFGVDQKRFNPHASPIETLAEIRRETTARISYATYDLAESLSATSAGADVIVQGEPMLSAANLATDLTAFVQATKAHSEEATR